MSHKIALLISIAVLAGLALSRIDRNRAAAEGKYLAEHKCTRTDAYAIEDNIYQCDNGRFTLQDIDRIVAGQK